MNTATFQRLACLVVPIFAAVACADVHDRTTTSTQEILGGQAMSSFPGVAWLDFQSVSSYYRCTASIIGPGTLLTSAHCFYETAACPSPFFRDYAHYGDDYSGWILGIDSHVGSWGQGNAAVSVEIHPQFDPVAALCSSDTTLAQQMNLAKHDLAVVHFNDPDCSAMSPGFSQDWCASLAFYKPLTLASESDFGLHVKPAAPFFAVGYGLFDPVEISEAQETHQFPLGVKRFGGIRIGPTASSEEWIHVVPDPALPLPGDSGGPLLLRTGATDKIFGVFSRFALDRPDGTYAIYTSLEEATNRAFVQSAASRVTADCSPSAPHADHTLCEL